MSNRFNLRAPSFWLATWFGCGLMRPAPGTWGSAAALPFAIILYQSGGIIVYLAALLAVLRIGIWAADEFDSQQNSADNKMIVIDEVVGQWISLIPTFFFFSMTPAAVFLSFLCFRFFDILKPWPVSTLDKNIKGGKGVMADDVAAGIYAALTMIGIHYAGLG